MKIEVENTKSKMTSENRPLYPDPRTAQEKKLKKLREDEVEYFIFVLQTYWQENQTPQPYSSPASHAVGACAGRGEGVQTVC